MKIKETSKTTKIVKFDPDIIDNSQKTETIDAKSLELSEYYLEKNVIHLGTKNYEVCDLVLEDTDIIELIKYYVGQEEYRINQRKHEEKTTVPSKLQNLQTQLRNVDIMIVDHPGDASNLQTLHGDRTYLLNKIREIEDSKNKDIQELGASTKYPKRKEDPVLVCTCGHPKFSHKQDRKDRSCMTCECPAFVYGTQYPTLAEAIGRKPRD